MLFFKTELLTVRRQHLGLELIWAMLATAESSRCGSYSPLTIEERRCDFFDFAPRELREKRKEKWS
jgi:hypothetical protein